MGEVYKSICSCGYAQNDIFVGFGMSDWYPELALCKRCEITTSADFLNETEPKCKKCSERLFAYNRDQLIKAISIEDKEERKYYCPKCHCFTLELHETGCWD